MSGFSEILVYQIKSYNFYFFQFSTFHLGYPLWLDCSLYAWYHATGNLEHPAQKIEIFWWVSVFLRFESGVSGRFTNIVELIDPRSEGRGFREKMT
jgi:hypothetical protein